MDLETNRIPDNASPDGLYHQLAQMRMAAGWNRPASARQGRFRPHRWSYTRAKAALDLAGRLVDTEIAERRNLVLVNPAEGITYATARTLMAAYQMILPGERARAHRHTPNALRLILEAAPGAYTIVDGEKVPMLPGDVLLTPNWSWHGHLNEGDSPAYWLDFLDVPLMECLESKMFEQHPSGFEASVGISEHSPMRFRWAEIERGLDRAAGEAGAIGSAEVELGNPALPTIALSMIRLPADGNTIARTSIANNIFAVVCGTGTIEVEGEEFAWERGDVVVIPARLKHACHAEERAVMLRVSDAPLMSWLRSGRTEPS